MRNFISISILTLALGAFLMPVALAESNPGESDYRVPVTGAMELTAEASGHKVYLKWSAFEGYRDEAFKYYKVVRSHSNPNPVYPEDDGIAYFAGLGDLRYTDENAWKSAYYRICVITDVKGRHCSNTVWVEIEKDVKAEKDHDCKKWSDSGECVMTHDQWKEQKDAERKEWEQKQNEAKERLETKKATEREEWEKHQAEKRADWEAKKEMQKKELAEKTEIKKDEMMAEKEERKAEIWERLYKKLDEWLEKFGDRLQKSDLTNAQKLAKIETVQERFYTWEEGNEMRMRIVDHLDEQLNKWKTEYAQENDFAEVEDFLEGLLD